jgi:RimJ/RimL family protein N-acetyltransferase
MGAATTVATKHLVGARLGVSDLDVLCAMHRDPRVMITLGGIRSAPTTRAFLRDNLRHWQRHDHGLWMFRDKATGRFAGRGGLRRVVIHGRPEVEISYALMAEFWGKGLATEIARLSLDTALGPLGLRDIVAFTIPTNHASRRVMEKLGFRYERGIFIHGLPHVLYRFTR